MHVAGVMPALSTDWDSRSPSGGKVGGHKKGLLDVSLDGAQGQSAHKASYKSPFADLGGAAARHKPTHIEVMQHLAGRDVAWDALEIFRGAAPKRPLLPQEAWRRGADPPRATRQRAREGLRRGFGRGETWTTTTSCCRRTRRPSTPPQRRSPGSAARRGIGAPACPCQTSSSGAVAAPRREGGRAVQQGRGGETEAAGRGRQAAAGARAGGRERGGGAAGGVAAARGGAQPGAGAGARPALGRVGRAIGRAAEPATRVGAITPWSHSPGLPRGAILQAHAATRGRAGAPAPLDRGVGCTGRRAAARRARGGAGGLALRAHAATHAAGAGAWSHFGRRDPVGPAASPGAPGALGGGRGGVPPGSAGGANPRWLQWLQWLRLARGARRRRGAAGACAGAGAGAGGRRGA